MMENEKLPAKGTKRVDVADSQTYESNKKKAKKSDTSKSKATKRTGTSDRKKKPSEQESFPERLMQLINDNAAPEHVKWIEHEEAISFKTDGFQQQVLDKFFQGLKYDSFIRKLNRWGFRRVTSDGVPAGQIAYYHNSFRRDEQELLKTMGIGKKHDLGGPQQDLPTFGFEQSFFNFAASPSPAESYSEIVPESVADHSITAVARSQVPAVQLTDVATSQASAASVSNNDSIASPSVRSGASNSLANLVGVQRSFHDEVLEAELARRIDNFQRPMDGISSSATTRVERLVGNESLRLSSYESTVRGGAGAALERQLLLGSAPTSSHAAALEVRRLTSPVGLAQESKTEVSSPQIHRRMSELQSQNLPVETMLSGQRVANRSTIREREAALFAEALARQQQQQARQINQASPAAGLVSALPRNEASLLTSSLARQPPHAFGVLNSSTMRSPSNLNDSSDPRLAYTLQQQMLQPPPGSHRATLNTAASLRRTAGSTIPNATLLAHGVLNNPVQNVMNTDQLAQILNANPSRNHNSSELAAHILNNPNQYTNEDLERLALLATLSRQSDLRNAREGPI